MAKPILSSSKGVQDGNLHCYHLPKGIVNFAIKRIAHSDAVFYAIETPSVELVPDWNHRYYFQYAPSSFTDDDITLEFTELGFLRRVHSFIDDQTDEFIEKIAELATTAVEAAAAIPSFKTRSLDGVQEELIYEARLDPFREVEVERLNQDLASFDPNLSFSAIIPDEDRFEPDPVQNASRQVLYSRPPVIAELCLNHGKMVDRHQVRLPHPYLTHVIEIPRAPFVKTEFLIEFNEMAHPMMINIKKPSTAMAMIQLPINILNAIISIPGKIFSFKINYDNSSHRLPAEASGPGAEDSSTLAPAPPPLPDPGALMPVPGQGAQTRGLGGGQKAGGSKDLENEVNKLRELVEVLNRRIKNYEKKNQ